MFRFALLLDALEDISYVDSRVLNGIVWMVSFVYAWRVGCNGPRKHPPHIGRQGHGTYRRLDVGAEATDARADRPGSEALNELDSKPLLLALSRLPVSGITLANCDDAPGAASTPGWRDAGCKSIDDEGWVLL